MSEIMSQVMRKSSTVCIYEFNMLAEGLVGKEFISSSIGSLQWNIRGNNIVKLIDNLFEQGVDIVVTLENDHPIEIAEKLQKSYRRIDCCFQRVRSKDNKNSGFTQLLKRSKVDRSYTFQHSIRDEQDLLEFLNLMNSDKPADCHTDFSRNDAYVADYTTCIYWNASKIQGFPLFQEFNPLNFLINRGYKIYTGRGDNGFIQKFMKDGIEFNVLAAHLKSGERENDEISRVSQLTSLLDMCIDKKNPIVVMDSNSSIHYVNGTLENIYGLFTNYGFYNLINELEKPCFKMRGADGDQPHKFAELMYDGIDKILVKNGVKASPCKVKGEPELRFLEYNSLIYRFRTVRILRERISNWILNTHNVFDTNGKLIHKKATELRVSSGQCVPIQDKESGEVLKFMSSDVSSRWGQDMTLNSCIGMANYLKNGIGDDEIVVHNLDVTDEQLTRIFSYLCPNNEMCSDHPLVGVVVEISE